MNNEEQAQSETKDYSPNALIKARSKTTETVANSQPVSLASDIRQKDGGFVLSGENGRVHGSVSDIDSTIAQLQERKGKLTEQEKADKARAEKARKEYEKISADRLRSLQTDCQHRADSIGGKPTTIVCPLCKPTPVVSNFVIDGHNFSVGFSPRYLLRSMGNGLYLCPNCEERVWLF